MRICFDARGIRPHWDGIGTYAYSLIRAMGEIEEDEPAELIVLISGDLRPNHPIHRLDGRIRLVRVPARTTGLLGQVRVPLALRALEYDVYHYPHFDLPLAAPGPRVITIHDLKYVLHPRLFGGLDPVKRRAMKLMMGVAVRRADRVIAVSEATRRDVLQVFAPPPSRVVTIPEALPLLEREAAVPGRWERLTRPYFVFIGQRRPHKNVLRLIRAHDRLLDRLPEGPDLVLAGRRYGDWDEPERLVESLGRSERVRFVGYLDEESKATVLRDAVALVYPSLYEGFGLPILEAMSAGVPVITSNGSSMSEVAGEAALLVDPESVESLETAMWRVATDMTLRRTLIDRGRKRERRFSWRRAAQETLRLYREVVGG